MFSGQGSQYYGMGRKLYEHDATFRYWMKYLDEIVSDHVGVSIVSQIYQDKKILTDLMDKLTISHPAIFMVEFSMAKSLIHHGVQPDILLGTSLGEFACFALSGVLPIVDTIKLIVSQAEMIETRCVRGGMLAVMASPQVYLSDSQFHQCSDLAAINFDTHFVIAGANEALESIKCAFGCQNILTQAICVKQAFHSHYLDVVADDYKALIEMEKYADPKYPVFSCSINRLLDKPRPTHLWDCVRRPILFQHGIRQLEGLGAACQYIDVGPSGTLATFVKYNLDGSSLSEVFPVLTMHGRCQENLQGLSARFSNTCVQT